MFQTLFGYVAAPFLWIASLFSKKPVHHEKPKLPGYRVAADGPERIEIAVPEGMEKAWSSKQFEKLTAWELYFIHAHLERSEGEDVRCPDCELGMLCVFADGGGAYNVVCNTCEAKLILSIWPNNQITGERLTVGRNRPDTLRAAS